MLGNSKSPVSFGSSCSTPNQTGLLPNGSIFPGNNQSQGCFSNLSRNVFRCSSTPEITTTTSASYGGTVTTASYGGSTDTCYRFHYNQGIGNGAEGGDPGNSHPHGSSNDELGQTPGCNKKLFF